MLEESFSSQSTYTNNNYGLVRIQETQEEKNFPIHLKSDFNGLGGDFHVSRIIVLFSVCVTDHFSEKQQNKKAILVE